MCGMDFGGCRNLGFGEILGDFGGCVVGCGMCGVGVVLNVCGMCRGVNMKGICVLWVLKLRIFCHSFVILGGFWCVVWLLEGVGISEFVRFGVILEGASSDAVCVGSGWY